VSVPERLNVVESSRRWLGTPYHHRASVLGAGVDCAQLVLEAFVGAGLEERFDPGEYNRDWHLHRSEERYLEFVERYMTWVDQSYGEDKLSLRPKTFVCKPADVLMFRVGRTFSHAAIVTRWPYIIHAYFPARMVEEVSIIGTPMAERPMRVYSYWGT
jgi:cell wall-associated NlpC family hydrolase